MKIIERARRTFMPMLWAYVSPACRTFRFFADKIASSNPASTYRLSSDNCGGDTLLKLPIVHST